MGQHMLSPHALIAGVATFVWCILLFGIAPLLAATFVRRDSVAVVAPKRLERDVRTFARKSTSFGPATTTEDPPRKPKKKHPGPR